MSVSAIVLAAGRSLRFRFKTPKPLAEINSKPVIIYSLDILSSHPLIKEIIVIANEKNLKSITSKIKQYLKSKPRPCAQVRGKRIQIVKGGLRRQDSVYCGLKALSCDSDLALIHDAARPFINKRLVSCVIKEAARTGAAILGVPLKATVKKVVSCQSSVASRSIVEKTIDRENLWEIQTPQVFKRSLILEAYKKFGNIDVTDDSMLVEKLGAKVSVVLGSYNNIKITTVEDLTLANAIAKNGI